MTQEIVGKNKFGSEVVRFKYKVIFTYNGSVANVGKYIGYATVEPAHLRVGWGGFKVDVQVAVPQVFNMGTTENPIAGMKIQVRYAVDTIVVHDETTDSYILSGSGNVSAL